MSEEDKLYDDQDTQKDKYLTFHIGSEDYAIAITYVTEIIGMLKVTEVPQTPDYIKGVINLRGKVIPVMDIRLRFKMDPRDYDERTCVIVVNHKENTVGLVVDTVSEVLDIPEGNVEGSPHYSQNDGNNFISGMGGVLSNLFLILLTVIFMLFEADSIPRRLHIALADPDMKLKHIDKFIRSVNSYLAIKTVVSLGTGVIIGVWLYVMGVDHFMLWAVLAFMLNFIPNIGSIIAALPAVLIAFVQLGPAAAGFAALGFLLINTIMGNMVEPRLMGKGMGLSTLVVFLSLIFWGWLLGTVGMLLSVPLTMVVKIALESREESKWLAVLLSSEGEKATAK